MIESWAIKKILRAFEEKDVCAIQTLVLRQCINPNALLPSKGVTLLHLIIGHQSESFAFRIAKLFLRCGGDPNVQSSDGVTPLHVAAAWGRTRILHLLLVNGGDPWLQDDEKKNAFNYAFEEREWNAIEMLHHFQQMHSAANCRQDIDPKYERSLERVLLRKGEEMFSYAPGRKSTKSMTTQTQIEPSSSSPVQEKIRYFEPSSPELCRKDSDKHIGWSKDFFQASCDVIVHRDPTEDREVPEEKQETFVSSIRIDTSPACDSAEKTDQSLDVRGQLFVELREAVRRRSKQKMAQEERQLVPAPDDSILIDDDPSKDSFVAKEVSYLYGINLEQSKMLKNMSDFATKVMNEIEVTECDRMSEKTSDRTIDLCASSNDLTGLYVSCEDGKSEPERIRRSIIGQNDSSTSNVYVTPHNSEIDREPGKEEVSNESFVSVAEEYKYTDQEEGVVLLEKKFVVTPTIRRLCPPTDRPFCSHTSKFHEEANPFPYFTPTVTLISPTVRPFVFLLPESLDASELIVPGFSFEEEVPEEATSGDENASTVSSQASTVPSCLSYNSDVLRYELNGLGYHPGPITTTTKKLYLRKLWRLKKAMKTPVTEEVNESLVHSPILERTLTSREHFDEIPTFAHLEEEMVRSFEGWTKRKWREGKNKTSFNYLLLDPRVSLNLPKRAPGMTGYDSWKCFLSGIFYVGKGKRSRPYAHLYKAIGFWENKTRTTSPDEKTERILEIWKEGLGVVCLQVFQNTIPVEALTREAAMIEALGVYSLKNKKAGEYYGVASAWPTRHKIRLGTFLLHKAMLIFINEGERQIRPYDID